MKKKPRLSSSARRQTIIEAARHLFSERGFHGVTTRELADAADVSEALMFRHFPSKEALYKAMLELCQKSETWSEANKLLELEPSTSTLAIMLHYIGTKIVSGNDETRLIHRMMLRSLSEDGAYSRIIFKHVESTWIAQFNACGLAAYKAGDMRTGVDKPNGSGWLIQHVFMMLAFMHTPASSVANYKMSRTTLVEIAVTFCLRGLGIKDEAIQKYYNPKAFGLLASEDMK